MSTEPKAIPKRTDQSIQLEIQEIVSGLPTDAHQRVMRTPWKYRLMYARSLQGHSTVSPRAAIKSKCYECVGFDSVAQSVGNCNCRSCPLWHFRPFQSGAATETAEKSEE